MKERPILFSAPMVRAILEGRKTQTRRVVKRQPVDFHDGMFWYEDGDACMPACPYGAPGDRLWVRETFALEHCCDGNPPPFNDGRPVKRRPADDYEGDLPEWTQAHYRATDPDPSLCYEYSSCKRCEDGGDGCCHWKPSIHMPRWASRLTLEVAGVRVERLQQISEADAKAEGAAFTCPQCGNDLDDEHGAEVHAACDEDRGSHVEGFRRIWHAINGADSWAANPWVWVVEFKRVTQ